MSQRILITGGAGFIGSVISSYLLDHDFKVVVIDDLSNSSKNSIDERATFYHGSILNKSILLECLVDVDVVIHCAAKTLVEESVLKPDLYESINVQGTKVLLDAMEQIGVDKIIFSSSAAVYGDAVESPIFEDSFLAAFNPYGTTKLKCEQEISRRVKFGLSAITFRYFNIAGSYRNKFGKLMSENHKEESHLIPNVLNRLLKDGPKAQIAVYGNSWLTPDGSCIRDFLHVEDVAHAHILAISKLVNSKHQIFNLGSGKGYSVLEVIHQIKIELDVTLSENFYPPRLGDPAILVSSITKAEKFLGWQPKLTMDRIILDSLHGSRNSNNLNT